jgi:hypothetical protein
MSLSSASTACFESRWRSASARAIAACARGRELDVEEQADEDAVEERDDDVEQEVAGALVHVVPAVALRDDHQHDADERADRDGDDQPAQRMVAVPRPRDVDAVGDREALDLDRDERVPERAHVVDPQHAGDAGVDRGDQRDRDPRRLEAARERGQDRGGRRRGGDGGHRRAL